MKVNDVMNKFDNAIGILDSIVISNDDAWLNEDGTDHARVNGKSVFMDITDLNIRKTVFTRSIYRALQKNNWHTDIIKSIEDVDSSSENSKIAVFHEGSSMFPDYRIYLKDDGDLRTKMAFETQNSLKTIWKTDHEFFIDAVKIITNRVVNYGEYCGYFLRYFNDNEYGITIDDVKKDFEATDIVKDAVFANLTNPIKQFDND